MAVPMGILMGIINLMGMTIDTPIGNMMDVTMGEFHYKYDGLDYHWPTASSILKNRQI